MGIGVANVHEAFRFYRQHFGVDIPVFEEAATAALMLPYTGGQPRDRHAILAINGHGGGGMEIWQYTSRTPQPPQFKVKLGDLGLFACKIKCANAEAAFHFLRKKNDALILGGLEPGPEGRSHFFLRDPWGNVFEVTESGEFFKNPMGKKGGTGGVFGAVIGVSDIERSLDFYKKMLGYDVVVFDETGQFRDLAGLDGGFDTVRRVLLRHSEERRGPFSPLLGKSEIELVEVKNRQPRKIFENRLWGDLGFIHLCFDVHGMDALREKCAVAGHPFTVDSGGGTFDMGEAAGRFAYIEDPDGTLVEFVETHKVPILKKLGWYLDLRKREPSKPLPRWMIRAMSLGRVDD